VSRIDLITLVVAEYDPAISFFVDALGFELIEDSPASADDGSRKRWVVVRPPLSQTGILLAKAMGADQEAVIGNQTAGRVGFFLRVEDFDTAYQNMLSNQVEFLAEPRDEEYGRVAMFLDVSGNRWDLIGPRNEPQRTIADRSP
jgi:catechol 2,3-dioxygenase-like lactoylglutathione lyase family enzyme